jgi:hypothetical protein
MTEDNDLDQQIATAFTEAVKTGNWDRYNKTAIEKTNKQMSSRVKQ